MGNKDQTINLKQRDVVQLAKMVTAQSIAAMRDEIVGVVQFEMSNMPKVLPREEVEKKVLCNVSPRRYGFLYTEPPPPTASNYTKVLMASVKWRSGKGEILGSAVLFKQSTNEKLVVDQYGAQCSVLRMDKAQKCAEFDSANKMITPGMSVWTQFKVLDGVLEDVVRQLKAKGWGLLEPMPKQQLELVDA